MQANRGRDTGPELSLRSALHRRGLRFRLHQAIVPGTRRSVDIVFKRARVAVLVDGCFWHGCPTHGSTAKANASFWKAKIIANKRRDADTDRRLRNCGWEVMRIWEHERPESAAARIKRAIERRGSRAVPASPIASAREVR